MKGAPEPGFSDEKIQRAIKRIQHPSFYGELTLKSVGGKVTDLKFGETKKPKDEVA